MSQVKQKLLTVTSFDENKLAISPITDFTKYQRIHVNHMPQQKIWLKTPKKI
jgi:hypothetical protein